MEYEAGSELTYCTNCGSGLPTSAAYSCGECGFILAASDKLEQNSDMTASSASMMFMSNSKIGLNRWWRWVVSLVVILVIWQGFGSIPWFVACSYLKNTQLDQFACEDGLITGDSPIPDYVLANYSFIVGIIGMWLAVKLIHKKTLTQIVTGRRSFDYSRVIYSMWIGLLLSTLLLVLNYVFLGSEIEFRGPNPWEYATFTLFAIVLTPYQAGFEEALFRGYLIQGVSLILDNKVILAVGTSLLFTAPHLLNPEPYEYGFAPYVTSMLIAGMFFAFITLLDGGIELAVGVHAVNNLWIGLIANTDVTVMPTPSLFVTQLERYVFFPDIFSEIVVYLILLAVLGWKYRWFKSRRLFGDKDGSSSVQFLES